MLLTLLIAIAATVYFVGSSLSPRESKPAPQQTVGTTEANVPRAKLAFADADALNVSAPADEYLFLH